MARGDVYLVEIPYSKGPAGREQAGRRPAVAVQTDDSSSLPTAMIIPTTTNLKALQFLHTIKMKPSRKNGFTQTSVLLVFQLRAIDKKRIIKKIGQLEQSYLKQLEKEVRKLLAL